MQVNYTVPLAHRQGNIRFRAIDQETVVLKPNRNTMIRAFLCMLGIAGAALAVFFAWEGSPALVLWLAVVCGVGAVIFGIASLASYRPRSR